MISSKVINAKTKQKNAAVTIQPLRDTFPAVKSMMMLARMFVLCPQQFGKVNQFY
jgi:hypothetical protein